MTALAIRVDCAAFDAASTVLACDVAQGLAADTARLLAALDGCGAMAGDDPAGAQWGGAYDEAAAAVFRSVGGTVNASFRLAGLLEQTGFNYGTADSASVLGGTVPVVPDVTGWANQTCNPGVPASAVGAGSGSLPMAWSLIESVVDRVWPNGHQDGLHEAASAWRSFASALETRCHDVTRAYACIDAQDVPEAPVAHRWCTTVAARVQDLTAAAAWIAAGCDGYAAALDQAHADVLAELGSLLHWTEGIQITGGLFAIVTFGLSEAAAQAAEVTRIAVTASRVGEILSRLGEVVRGLLEPLVALVRQAHQTLADLRPLMTAKTVAGVTDTVRLLRTELIVAVERGDTAAAQGMPLVPTDLSPVVRANFGRFEAKLPKNATSTFVTRLPDGRIEFSAQVPGQVPGSCAIYLKVVESTGQTVKYLKTTITPDGVIAHTKVKFG